MRIQKFILPITILLTLLSVAGWLGYTYKNLERNAFVVLDLDGNIVPEAELDWVLKIADTLVWQADDRWLQDRIDTVGVYGAYNDIYQLRTALATMYAVHIGMPSHFPVQTSTGTYYFDHSGALLLAPPNDFQIPLPFYDGLAAVGTFSPVHVSSSMSFSFRYIDLDGNTVIPGPFVRALPFSDGIAVVAVETDEGKSRYGTIDRTGAWQIEPKFDEIFEFVDGLAAAQINNPDYTAKVAGFIDHTGKFVVSLDKVQRMKSSLHDGMALVWRTEAPTYIFVDRAGKTVLTPDAEQVEPFYEGRAAFWQGDTPNTCGYMDKAGNTVIPAEYFLPPPFEKGIVPLVKVPWLATVLHPPDVSSFSYEETIESGTTNSSDHFTITFDE